MSFDDRQLWEIARDYPWYMFTGEEIAVLCNVGEQTVSRVRRAGDSPFRYGKCRPEWFTGWMLNHPECQSGKDEINGLPRQTRPLEEKTGLIEPGQQTLGAMPPSGKRRKSIRLPRLQYKRRKKSN